MKKLILSLCLCASVVGLCFAADQAAKPDAVAQLNKIYADGKAKYAGLTKEIEKLKTGNRINSKTEIATAEKKQQAIIDSIKAVKIDGDVPAMQLQAKILRQLREGRDLTSRELEALNDRIAYNAGIKAKK